MSKKSLLVAGAAVLVVVALAAAALLVPRKTPAPTTTVAGTGSNSSNATTEAGQGQGATTTSSATTTPGVTTTSPQTTSGGADENLPAGALKPFPRLPDPGIPAQKPTSPVEQGQTLAPLTTAPDPTISGLAIGVVPVSSQYTIVMRPLGIGPSMVLGSRLVIRVDSAKPIGQAPAYNSMVDANVLALVDTTHGGTVTKGGTYTATLTFISDGAKLLPVLSEATAAK